MCLHATRLAFAHPGTGARVAFESATPGDWV
jgi:23S rRNA-/tRNA-specific pseudouridylate synthase